FLHSLFTIPSFFFNATPTTDIYPLSLHDALPIFPPDAPELLLSRLLDSYRTARDERFASTTRRTQAAAGLLVVGLQQRAALQPRSEEHTSELQSRGHLVCRLLLEKKKKNKKNYT